MVFVIPRKNPCALDRSLGVVGHCCFVFCDFLFCGHGVGLLLGCPFDFSFIDTGGRGTIEESSI